MAQLYEFCEQIERIRRMNEGRIESSADKVQFDSVTVETPSGKTIIKDLTFNVNKKTNLLITGP